MISPLKTYEQMLLAPHSKMFIDGETIHIVRKCGCEKCASIIAVRVQNRKDWKLRNREKSNSYNKAYQQMLRARAEAMGRPRTLSLSWLSSDASNNSDWEFYQAVNSYADSKGLSVNKLIKILLEKEIKKGVRS